MIGFDSSGCFDSVLTESVSFNRIDLSGFFAIKLDNLLSSPYMLRKVPLGWFQTLRTSAEEISCPLQLLGSFPMHSDSQPFVRIAV
jgi:hypothetical protein